MKIYLSVPMIANRALERARVLERAIKDCGHELTSPWVLGPIEYSTGSVNVFERDRRGAENSDAILADVSEPSTGVGMEIMAAYKAGKRIITVAKKGSRVSNMLMHMDGREIVEFEDNEELYAKLSNLLQHQAESRRQRE